MVMKSFELPEQKHKLSSINLKFKSKLRGIPRAGQLVGFSFKDVVPASVYIDFGFSRKVEIKTRGKNPFILDSPIMLTEIPYTDIKFGFGMELEFESLYSSYDIRSKEYRKMGFCNALHTMCTDKLRKTVRPYGMGFYDGFYTIYIDGMVTMKTTLRPLKNIVQDLVQEGPPMLMRRSNRDAKPFAGPICIVFEP